ncbi:MAG TPA: N-acetylmuramoyl-L-alanine amidase [Gemmatimonadales bacterium]|nr:N-acetylmuramoyl-L-alanine amidase [Gemmatimonadales bacterium]
MRRSAAWLLVGAALLDGPGAPVPGVVTVATSRGEVTVPVRTDRGHPSLAAVRLRAALPITLEVGEAWARVALGGRPFRFLLDAAFMEFDGRIVPLAGGAYVTGDTLFVPLQWLTEHVPRVLSEAYRYDPLAARFEEAALAPTVRTAAAPAPPRSAPRAGALVPQPPLRRAHTVVVDAGHGGVDPGNPGLFFPAGVTEKDVTLSLARLLRAELISRGITVTMTRSTDTLIDFRDRAQRCGGTCELFVSLHVNSLPRRGGYRNVRGFETYFLDEARTAEARRVAEMENDALRYETDRDPADDNDFAFILKDLQTNEYLRESAALAEVVQRHGAASHPGGDRGVSQARFAVLSWARRPAILVETGFSTNREDARFLASTAGQRRLARALADGIVDYLVQYERKLADGNP